MNGTEMNFEKMVELCGDNDTAISCLFLLNDPEAIASLSVKEWLEALRWRPAYSDVGVFLGRLSDFNVAELFVCMEELCQRGIKLPTEAYERLYCHVEAGCSSEDVDKIVRYVLNREPHNDSPQALSFTNLRTSVQKHLLQGSNAREILHVCTLGSPGDDTGSFSHVSTWCPKYPDAEARAAVNKVLGLFAERDVAAEFQTPLEDWFIFFNDRESYWETLPCSPVRRFPDIIPVVVGHILAQSRAHPIEKMIGLMHMCVKALHGQGVKIVAEHLVGRLQEWTTEQLMFEIGYTQLYEVRSIGQLCENLYATMMDDNSNRRGVPVEVDEMRLLHERIFAEALNRVSTLSGFVALLKALDDSLFDEVNKGRLQVMRQCVLAKLLEL